MTSQTRPKKKEKGLYFSAVNDTFILPSDSGPPSSFALVPGNCVAGAGGGLPRRLTTVGLSSEQFDTLSWYDLRASESPRKGKRLETCLCNFTCE